jgi:CRP/FNR family transcriptional regulator, cyclic AMP receptor protein
MTETKVLGAFGGHAFLSGLSQRHLMLLASGVRPVRIAAGDYLGREGEIAGAFYLIGAGNVTLGIHTPDRGVVVVQSVGPGSAVGWSWLVAPYRWRFDCRAAEAVEALAFDAQWLRERCEQDHELGYHLLKHMVEMIGSRLAATRLQLLDLLR